VLKWFRKKEDELPESFPNGSPEEGEPASAESIIQGEEPQGDRKGFFHRLKERLTKTRETFVGRVDQLVLGKKEIDEDLLDDLEEILITSDLGVDTTQALIALVQQKVKRRELDNPERLRETLQEEILRFLEVPAQTRNQTSKPLIILVIGVNGVGKTTTIGKLAHQYRKAGKKVLLVAGDTFRAAAGEQLEIWAKRSQAEIIRQKEGSDPSAVVLTP
jgi:fused signal recognition particle receptor